MKKLNTTITNTINKHFNAIIYGICTLALVVFWTVASIMFTGCERQQDPQKPVTVQVKTEGLFIKEMTKSFNLSQWTYNYNQNPYELRFEGTKGNVYTFQKTIAQLKIGFPITVVPDTYIVTYATEHPIATVNVQYNKLLDDKLDITITEPAKVITSSGQIILNAKNDDALIIMDCGINDAYIMNDQTNTQFHFFTIAGQTFKYAYYNIEGNMRIFYTPISGYENTLIIPNVMKNNVYHVVNALNNTILIEEFNYNLIGL